MLTKKTKRQIHKLIHEAKERMFLNNWEIFIQFKPDCNGNVMMDVDPDYEYLRAVITVYEKPTKMTMKEWGDREIKKACYHEMAHVLSNELYQAGKNRHCKTKELDEAWERLAELIARIAYK